MLNVSTNRTSILGGIPGPLSVASDMSSRWTNEHTDFDTAAHRMIAAHRQDGQPRDLPVMNLQTWGIVPVNGHFGLAPLSKIEPPMVLRSTAFSHLMNRLGAPADFVRERLPEPLQLATTNYLLQCCERGVPTLLRLRGDQIAAVVSDRYAPLDLEELLGTVRDVLVRQAAISDVEVRSFATGVTDVFRMVFPATQTPVKVGDISALGIDISSSSFARSALHVRGLVWRLKCTNGLRVGESTGAFSFRHVGDSRRLRDGITEAIPSALVQARGLMQRWQVAVGTMVTDVAAQIEHLTQLTVAEKKKVEEKLVLEVGSSKLPERVSAYEFLNAITASAHEAVPARRLDIESTAGSLLRKLVA